MYKKFTISLISILIILIIIEIFLRTFVIKPWKNISKNDPLVFKSDPVLGWKANKGTFDFLPVHKTGKKFNMSFNQNGERKSSIDNSNTNNEILIIGGSFVQGWGVNDDETFSFKLQKKFPKYKIYNFGQGGYGSVQSLLILKEQISKTKSPKLVIYGLIQHHEYRNIAHPGWLRMLSQYSSRGHVYTPYAVINENNQLLLKTPIRYSNFPFRDKSSIITLVEKAYMKLSSRKRIYIKSKLGEEKKQQTIVTKKIILQMKEISEKNGSDFILVNLDWKGSFKIENYRKYFEKNKIKFIDCSLPSSKKFIIPGDYHPNKNAHTKYKDCVSNYLNDNKVLTFLFL